MRELASEVSKTLNSHSLLVSPVTMLNLPGSYRRSELTGKMERFIGMKDDKQLPRSLLFSPYP